MQDYSTKNKDSQMLLSSVCGWVFFVAHNVVKGIVQLLFFWRRSKHDQILPYGADVAGLLPDLTDPTSFAGKSKEIAKVNRIIFNYSTIALGAKLTKLNGKVTRQEYFTFIDAFPIPNTHIDEIKTVFYTAYRDKAGFEHYARQITNIFPPGHRVLLDVLEKLIRIAVADSAITDEERIYLKNIAQIFGINDKDFKGLIDRYMVPSTDPYAVLGVKKSISDEELKEHYHRLIRECHPDYNNSKYENINEHQQWISKQMKASNASMINAAYHQIRRMRRI